MDGIYYYGEIEDSDGAALVGENLGDPTESSTTIAKIKLKVKQDVTEAEETVALSSLSVIDNTEENSYDLTEGSSIDFTITKKTSNEAQQSGSIQDNTNKNTNVNTGNQASNTAGNISTGGQTKNTNANEPSTSNSPAPYTGVEEVTPIIFVVAIITIFTLIRLKKYKDIK